MASNNSTVDGMGFEEVNQAGSSTALVSAQQGYFTGSVVVDSHIIAGGEMYTTNLYLDTISATSTISNGDGDLNSVSIGSGTAVYGAKIQAGSGALASNTAWITFPNSYNGIPAVFTQNNTALDSELLISAGSLNAGSFSLTGTNASDKFNWMAVGI